MDGPLSPKTRITRGLKTAVDMPYPMPKTTAPAIVAHHPANAATSAAPSAIAASVWRGVTKAPFRYMNPTPMKQPTQWAETKSPASATVTPKSRENTGRAGPYSDCPAPIITKVATPANKSPALARIRSFTILSC